MEKTADSELVVAPEFQFPECLADILRCLFRNSPNSRVSNNPRGFVKLMEKAIADSGIADFLDPKELWGNNFRRTSHDQAKYLADYFRGVLKCEALVYKEKKVKKSKKKKKM